VASGLSQIIDKGFHFELSILIGRGAQDGRGMQSSDDGRESLGFLDLPMQIGNENSRCSSRQKDSTCRQAPSKPSVDAAKAEPVCGSLLSFRSSQGAELVVARWRSVHLVGLMR